MLKKILFIISPCLICFFGCTQNSENKRLLTVQASSLPQAELLKQIQPDLKTEGIELKIIIVDDYNIPNRALSEGEIDANFFQHAPFLEQQVKEFEYDICPLTQTHIEPMGIYSLNGSLTDLKSKSLVTIPNDPSNETRALLLLEKAGLILLKKDNDCLTLRDIIENPKELKFKEIDAAFLTRTLNEVGASVIPTNYALLIGLNPLNDALFLEDSSSPYANIIAIQKKDLSKPELLSLKKHMESEKMHIYIIETYKGALVPAH